MAAYGTESPWWLNGSNDVPSPPVNQPFCRQASLSPFSLVFFVHFSGKETMEVNGMGFLQTRRPFCHSINSVKALKEKEITTSMSVHFILGWKHMPAASHAAI